MIYRAFIIHLERANARAKQVERLRQKFPAFAHIVPAVDSESLTEDCLSSYQRFLWAPRYPFELSRAEIACFQSHRKCWKAIIDEGLDCALILEDDVEFDDSLFADAFALALSHLAPGDFVRFPIKVREAVGIELATLKNIRLLRPQEVGLGMQAQLVTRDAAVELLRRTVHFDRPVDTFLQMPWLHHTRILTVLPSGVKEISSELGGSTLSLGQTNIKGKILREVFRPIYRRRIRKLAMHHNRTISCT